MRSCNFEIGIRANNISTGLNSIHHFSQIFFLHTSFFPRILPRSNFLKEFISKAQRLSCQENKKQKLVSKVDNIFQSSSRPTLNTFPTGQTSRTDAVTISLVLAWDFLLRFTQKHLVWENEKETRNAKNQSICWSKSLTNMQKTDHQDSNKNNFRSKAVYPQVSF